MKDVYGKSGGFNQKNLYKSPVIRVITNNNPETSVKTIYETAGEGFYWGLYKFLLNINIVSNGYDFAGFIRTNSKLIDMLANTSSTYMPYFKTLKGGVEK